MVPWAQQSPSPKRHLYRFSRFWAIVCKTVRPTLSDRCLSVCPVCLYVLSVTLVYCGQTVGWIKTKLGMEVGLDRSDFVLDGEQLPKMGPSPQFLDRVHCGQTAGRIKMPLGTEIDLGPGHTVLEGDPAPRPRKGHSSPPLFSPCLLWPRSHISVTAELLYNSRQYRVYTLQWAAHFPLKIVASHGGI